MRARLVVTSGFGSGITLATLKILDGTCQKVERVDNNNTLSAVIAWPAPVTLRSTIRLTSVDGSVTEYRVTNIQESDDRKEARIDAVGPWLSIARAGLIRAVSNGATVYTFGGQFTISEALSEFFLPNCADDDLSWISQTLGPIETDALCVFTIDRWNRTQLLQDIIRQTGFEPYLYQSAPGALYQLAVAERRGSDAVPFTVADRTNLLRRATDQNDVAILTGVTPLGAVPTGDDTPAGIGENAWTVAVLGGGWTQFIDPAGLVQPIAFDGQYNGLYLEVATTTTPGYREILATRLVDQAVLLSDATGLSTTGLQVRICENASGDPLSRLVNPAGIATYGRVFDIESVPEARGERNWIRNGGLLAGASGWTAGAGGFVEPHAITENADVFGIKNGTTAAGNTSFAVDGFPPNTIVHPYDLLRIEGTQLCAVPSGTGHTITSDGRATITGVTPLAYSVTDGQVLSMDWFDSIGNPQTQSATVDGAQSAAATTLSLKTLTPVTRKLTNGDLVQFEFGGTYTGRTTGYNVVSNDTGTPIVQSRVWAIESGAFLNGENIPTTPALVVGDAVTLTDLAGNTYGATLNADHSIGSGSLSLDVTVPAYTVKKYSGGNTLAITAVKTDTALKTLTNASVEFAGAGTATASWSGGLPHSYSTARVRWMTSGSVLLDYLTVSSGAGSGATTAVLSYPNRARVYPGATFNNGVTGVDVLFCSTHTALDGTGAGTIPIIGTNTASLPAGAGVRLYRNIWGWPTAAPLTQVLHIVNGATSVSAPVLLRGTAPRTAWCVAEASVYVPIGTNFFSSKSMPYTNLCPVTLEVNDGVATYTAYAAVPIPATWATTDPRPVPVTFTLKCNFNLTASRMVTVKLSSPDAVAGNVYVHLVMHSAQLTVAPDDAVPFTHGSHATQLVQRGNRRLLAADMQTAPVRGTMIDWSQVPFAQLVPQRLALGQDVYIREYDATQRAMQLTTDPRDPMLVQVDFDRDTPRFESLVVA